MTTDNLIERAVTAAEAVWGFKVNREEIAAAINVALEEAALTLWSRGDFEQSTAIRGMITSPESAAPGEDQSLATR